ncbi:F0F1 ATP synthase subunit delta [Candidatus Profftella armatura]|uniref:ATP synthase subunit delta n=1 Tax=Candidatus Profftella armatura TaxID=669502 RepID=S5RPV1_9PROT|nr:F0F1 ATP synthase subunit delta [Candidatus Profftella armatura]AGS06903.1 F0F1 ATP synthase subunit delta [Candidatus Profftella armatura]ALC95985.1 hypothetical protein AMC77_01105 [Candidatus Profftella armatura]QLK13812.1 F0F1 ATP synthase subunit delta [Candidatus Profftella armatura]
MIDISTIARPYSKALFNFAKDYKKIEFWNKLITKIEKIIKKISIKYPNILIFSKYSVLPNVELIKIITNALKKYSNNHVKNFVSILVIKKRLFLLPEIIIQFNIMKNKYENVNNIKIVSAYTLTNEQLSDLIFCLEKKFNFKLRASVIIDKSLIGGLRLIIKDKVFDFSIYTKLKKLHSTLMIH